MTVSPFAEYCSCSARRAGALLAQNEQVSVHQRVAFLSGLLLLRTAVARSPRRIARSQLVESGQNVRSGSNADAPRLDIAALSVGSSGSLGTGHSVFEELLPVSRGISVVDRVFDLRLDEHRKALRKGRWLGSPPDSHPGE